MKLLLKKDITQQKADELRRSISEGKRIASSVDRLRETRADEEASLQRFREETIRNIHEETTQAAKERDEVRQEVSKLKREREELQKPLDEEWSTVLEDRETNQKEADRLANWGVEFQKVAQDLDVRTRSLEDERERVRSEREQSSRFFQDAIRDSEEAKISNEVERKAAQETLRLKAVVERELAARDASVAASERRISIRDESQDRRELELNARETLLADREQTLLRNVKRNG